MKFRAKNIDGLNYRKIGKLLGIKLQKRSVYISKKTVQHIIQKHPNDYALCLIALESVIKEPDYVGQSPHHLEKFELVKITKEGIVLIALNSIPDRYGDYPLESAYLIDKSALKRRIRIGHLEEFK